VEFGDAFFAEELQELSHATQNRMYAPGEMIVRKGKQGQSFLPIVSGRVEFFVNSSLDHAVAEARSA